MVMYGGLDLAKRIDNSAFIALEVKDGIMYQYAEKIWPHVDYSVVAKDIERYHKKLRFRRVGFDRTGAGDAVMELFTPKNIFEPIVFSNPKKIELINLTQGLMLNGKLKIKIGGELEKEIKEQQWDRSDAGNLIYRHPSKSHDDLFWALACACSVAAGSLSGIARPIMAIGKPDYRNLEREVDAEMEGYMSVV